MQDTGYRCKVLQFIRKSFLAALMKCSNYGVGWAELVAAAQEGDTKNVLRILKKDPELIYTADVVGETVLHVVARAGHSLTVSKMMEFMRCHYLQKVLLKKNIDGDTALHLAVKNKHREAAYELIGYREIAVNELNKDGLSPSDLAEKAGWSLVVIRYCAGVADIEMRIAGMDLELEELYKVKWIDSTPKGVRDAFLQASASGVIRTNQIQLELDRFGGNLLHIAARLGNVDVLKLLVRFMNSSELASLPLERDLRGDTALHLAFKGKHEASAVYLTEVAPKAAYMLNKEAVSPLYLAIELGYYDLVRYIFQQVPGTTINSSVRKSLLRAKKASIVHAAVRARNLGMLEKLLEELPDFVHSQNEEGWRPLSYAAYEGYLDEVRYFLDKFPESARIYDRDGSFPIHKAVGAGHVRIVEEFLSSRPSTIHDVDTKGQSILHIAVRYARADVFSYTTKIKEVEKIFQLKDQDGKTFMDLARELGYKGH